MQNDYICTPVIVFGTMPLTADKLKAKSTNVVKITNN